MERVITLTRTQTCLLFVFTLSYTTPTSLSFFVASFLLLLLVEITHTPALGRREDSIFLYIPMCIQRRDFNCAARGRGAVCRKKENAVCVSAALHKGSRRRSLLSRFFTSDAALRLLEWKMVFN